MPHAHTPGPWKAVEGNTCFQKLGKTLTTWPIYSSEGNIIAVAIQHDGENYSTATQFQDDAHLIAAAPDLLDALESLLSLGKSEQFGQWEQWEEVQTAHEVITRATGRARG